MAPTQKHDYASALRQQIETLAAHRSAQEEALRAKGEGGIFGSWGAEAAPLGARRRHGAPLLPSKETYASALKEQMEMRSVQQAEEACNKLQEPTEVAEDALDEILFGKGSRRARAAAPQDKSQYAADLQQQIAARRAQQAADAETLLQRPPPLPNNAFSSQAELVRGRRQASSIGPVSKSVLNAELKEQMAERANQKALNAFHKQAHDEVPAAVRGYTPRGGRRKCDVALPSKQSYALELQAQMAERKVQQAGQQQARAASIHAAFVGGDASDTDFARGRRHSGFVPPSKEELRVDLQRQMAERANAEAAGKFHLQVPDYLQPATDMGADSLECLMDAHADHASCSR